MDNPQHYQPLSHALNPTNYIQSIYPRQQQQHPQHPHQEEPNDVDDDNDSSSSPAQPTTAKRKPGRPRGSKNRKPRAAPGTSQKYLQAHPPDSQPSSSSAPPEVNAQNHQYYEFQWRMLTLCSEFYGAAEELVKGAPPLVIAQCYQMGPTAKVDPLNLLAEAKRICDDLLRNPQKLITQPPPPMVPAMPNYYQHAYTQSILSPTVSTPSTTTVISNPSSFTVPLAQGYYQYQPPQASASTATPSSSNQGTWSDEESEKLRKLAEASRNSAGDIDWDAVVAQWGGGRTRHQILIKATAMGLKESSSGPNVPPHKPPKRRRDDEDEPSQPTQQTPSTSSKTPPQPPSTHTSPTLHHPQPPPPTQPSPALHHPLPPQQPSPALHHPQPPSAPNKGLPWPMPTVAVNSPSPVLEDRGLPGYYRPRFIYTQRKDDP